MSVRAPLRFGLNAVTKPRSFRPLLTATACLGACAWIAGAMFALPRDPLAAAAVGAAPLLLIVLIAIPWARMAVVIAGGLLVLGGEDSVGPLKVVYGGVVVLCIALSATALVVDRRAWIHQFRHLVIPGVALGVVVIASAAFSPVPWDTAAVMRGSVFWLLIIAAPVLGLDAARSLTPQATRRGVGIVGFIVAVGFATHWLELRGVSALAIGHWLLPSVVVPAVGFTVAFVQSALTRGRNRFAWGVVAAAILVAMIATGSRTNLLFVTAIVGTLGARKLSRVPLPRALSTLGLIVSVLLLSVPVLVPFLITNPSFFSTRIAALANVFSGGLGEDASYLMRENQQSVALGIIGAHPWFGLGSGWVLDQVMDTPWVTVVRIGFLGVIALLVFLVSCGLAIARSGSGGRSSVAHTAASGSAVYFLCLLPLASPVDDHGFGFALMLIFALVGSHLRHLAEHPATATPSTPPKRWAALSNARRKPHASGHLDAPDAPTSEVNITRDSRR